MSSQRASYQLSAAQRAALQEAARLRQLQRQWQAAQLERSHQHRRAARLRQRYQIHAPEISLLAAAASGTADALAQDLATATAKTVELKAELDSIEHQGRRQEIHTMIATIIAHAQPVRLTPEPVHREQAIDEANRIVARLDPEVDQPARVGQILGSIATTARDRCGPLLAALRAEVDELNEAAVRRRSAAAALVSARVVAEQTGDRSLAVVLTSMQAEFDTGQSIDVDQLEHASDAALGRDEQEREHAHVLRVVMEAFGEIHYQVTGVEVNTPSERVLVRRDNGASRAVHVQVNSGGISVTPARLISVAVEALGTGALDPETERLVCQDATDVWRRIYQAGVHVAGRTLRLNSKVPREVDLPAEAPWTTLDPAVPKAVERRLP